MQKPRNFFCPLKSCVHLQFVRAYFCSSNKNIYIYKQHHIIFRTVVFHFVGTKKNVFHIFRHSSAYRREAYATIRASINIAETNDVIVVACVIGHNKIRRKNFQFSSVSLSFYLNTSRTSRLDLLMNEEKLLSVFVVPRILRTARYNNFVRVSQ